MGCTGKQAFSCTIVMKVTLDDRILASRPHRASDSRTRARVYIRLMGPFALITDRALAAQVALLHTHPLESRRGLRLQALPYGPWIGGVCAACEPDCRHSVHGVRFEVSSEYTFFDRIISPHSHETTCMQSALLSAGLGESSGTSERERCRANPDPGQLSVAAFFTYPRVHSGR